MSLASPHVKPRVGVLDRLRGQLSASSAQPALAQAFPNNSATGATLAPQMPVSNARHDSHTAIIKVAELSALFQIWRSPMIRRAAMMLASFVMLIALGATAQESRSEVSVQGTGFFTQDSSGQGVSRTTTDTGGFLVGYRYHINRWLAAEANYGFDRDTQRYFSTGG